MSIFGNALQLNHTVLNFVDKSVNLFRRHAGLLDHPKQELTLGIRGPSMVYAADQLAHISIAKTQCRANQLLGESWVKVIITVECDTDISDGLNDVGARDCSAKVPLSGKAEGDSYGGRRTVAASLLEFICDRNE